MNKEQKVRYINMLIKGVAVLTALKEENNSSEVNEKADRLLSDLNDMLVVLVLTENHPEAFTTALDNVENTIEEIERHTQI